MTSVYSLYSTQEDEGNLLAFYRNNDINNCLSNKSSDLDYANGFMILNGEVDESQILFDCLGNSVAISGIHLISLEVQNATTAALD